MRTRIEASAFDAIGRGYESVGGLGFTSDDPTAVLKTTYEVYRRTPDVLVLRGGEEGLLYTFTTILDSMDSPRSVAVHQPTDTVFLTGRTRIGPGVWEHVVIASEDGGKNWDVVLDQSGQLYFLSDRDGVFLQTDDDLLMLPLSGSTAVSAVGKAATTWGSLKQAR